MKKLFTYAVFLAFGVGTQAQNIFVQPIIGEQIPFPLLETQITFGVGTMIVSGQPFNINEVQNLSFVATQPTSIADLDLDQNSIVLFPNPVQDELTLSVQLPLQNLIFRIFDMTGRLLKSDLIRSETTVINMHNFRSGTYIISIDRSGQPIQSFQIVKQ